MNRVSKAGWNPMKHLKSLNKDFLIDNKELLKVMGQGLGEKGQVWQKIL